MSEVKLIGSSFLCIKSASLTVQRQHAYISNGHLKIKADVGKQFQGALNRGPLKEKLQSLWGSSRHDFWSICSVISRNVIIISQQETHYEKSPIKKKSYDFVSTTAQDFLLSSVSEVPCVPLLIQIPTGCDATDHTCYYWLTLATLDQHGVLLAPRGYQHCCSAVTL